MNALKIRFSIGYQWEILLQTADVITNKVYFEKFVCFFKKRIEQKEP